MKGETPNLYFSFYYSFVCLFVTYKFSSSTESLGGSTMLIKEYYPSSNPSPEDDDGLMKLTMKAMTMTLPFVSLTKCDFLKDPFSNPPV